MDLQLTGKLAVVTGSTSGIGQAIAQALVNEGATVVINGRDARRTEKQQMPFREPALRFPCMATSVQRKGLRNFWSD